MTSPNTPDRSLEWTGERCLPWIENVQVVYEHLHRYYLAAELAGGKRVLDLGSGEGFGAAILAEVAEHVIGIDLDPLVVEHSRRTYERPNLAFEERSILDLGAFEDDSFDLVVCFEVIEHVAEHDEVLAGVDRVLRPDGIFVVSTPDRDDYNAGHGANPFHVRELSRDEFEDLLRAHFSDVAVWRQGAGAGAYARLEDDVRESVDSRDVFVEWTGSWRRIERPFAPYLIAAASRVELPPLPRRFQLVDHGLLVAARERLATERERDRADDEHARAESVRIKNEALTRELAATRSELIQARADIGGATASLEYLRIILNSRSWRFLELLRRGRDFVRRRNVQAHRAAIDAMRSGTPPPKPLPATVDDVAPFSLPQPENPRVSIVIPVFNNAELTWRCLRSIAERVPDGLAETIVVDDRSTDDTPARLALVNGLHTIRNESNVGFLGSANTGAGAARGEFVVFLNNDTEVGPGWLENLVAAAESADDVGAVGSRLLYPDGTLQEAGGLIWSDGTGWNYGRGDDPSASQYGFRRTVDYCSAASLLVRRDLFEQAGGFDERYAPGYYEDVDLCFELRHRGFRTLYEPLSTVIHHEGATHGTDTAQGIDAPHAKSSQHENRLRFVEKWRDELQLQRANGEGNGLLGGRREERVNALIADHKVPARDEDAGSVRMYWILRLLAELGCRVTLYPENRAAPEPHTSELQSLGIEVYAGDVSFEKLADERRGFYDLVVVSRPNVATAVLDHVVAAWPDALTVYDTVDLHFLREERKHQIRGEPLGKLARTVRGQELDAIQRTKATAVVSEIEAEVVRSLRADARTVVLPTVHALDDGEPPPFEGRADLLFIGGFAHEPNIDAVEYFVADVLPLVRREVDARLWVLGTNVPESIRALQSPSVVVTGYVHDADPYFRSARVFVSPLRFGAGMKGKNGHAMALGLPIVTTTIGAEGMDLVDGRHVLVRDDPEGFARSVVELYTDRALWTRISVAARELVRERWTPDVMRGRLERLLAEVAARRA